MGLNADTRRSGCPISCSLDLLGDKWILLIVRDMVMMRKRYFKEFLASSEGVATNMLTNRLNRLEGGGIISKQPDPKNRRQIIYTLTEKGVALIPALVELMCWRAIYDRASNVGRDGALRIQQDKQYKQRVIRELTKGCLSTP